MALKIFTDKLLVNGSYVWNVRFTKDSFDPLLGNPIQFLGELDDQIVEGYYFQYKENFYEIIKLTKVLGTGSIPDYMNVQAEEKP